jgi:hypothetical protein
VRLAGPEVCKPAEVAGRAAGLRLKRAVGDGALRYAQVLEMRVEAQPQYPSPAALLSLAALRVRVGAPSEPLTPLYLRRPDVTEPTSPKRVCQ